MGLSNGTNYSTALVAKNGTIASDAALFRDAMPGNLLSEPQAVAFTPVGPTNFITNGNFSNGTTGWTVSTDGVKTLTVNGSGQAVFYAGSGSYWMWQSTSLAAGTYITSINVISKTTNDTWLRIGTGPEGNNSIKDVYNLSIGVNTVTFTITSTTNVFVNIGVVATGKTITFDDVSIVQSGAGALNVTWSAPAVNAGDSAVQWYVVQSTDKLLRYGIQADRRDCTITGIPAGTRAFQLQAINSVGYGVPAPSPTSYTFSNLISTSLVVYLEPYNYGGAGTTWTNTGSTGLTNNGTLAGPTVPTFNSGSIKYFTFTRNYLGTVNSYLNFNHMSIPRPASFGVDFTISAWINTTQVGGGTLHFQGMGIVTGEIPGVFNDFGLSVNSSGQLMYGDGKQGGGDITLSTTETVNTGNWTFVSVTRTQSTGAVKMYINGTLRRTGTCNSGNTLNVASLLLIGSNDDVTGYTWGGGIGHIMIHNSVLSDSDILHNYNGLKGYYYIV